MKCGRMQGEHNQKHRAFSIRSLHARHAAGCPKSNDERARRHLAGSGRSGRGSVGGRLCLQAPQAPLRSRQIASAVASLTLQVDRSWQRAPPRHDCRCGAAVG